MQKAIGRGMGISTLIDNKNNINLGGYYSYVTHSAINGAEYAIEKLNNLNKENLIIDLEKKDQKDDKKN